MKTLIIVLLLVSNATAGPLFFGTRLIATLKVEGFEDRDVLAHIFIESARGVRFGVEPEDLSIFALGIFGHITVSQGLTLGDWPLTGIDPAESMSPFSTFINYSSGVIGSGESLSLDLEASYGGQLIDAEGTHPITGSANFADFEAVTLVLDYRNVPRSLDVTFTSPAMLMSEDFQSSVTGTVGLLFPARTITLRGVPEPSAWVLGLLACSAQFVNRRRKRATGPAAYH